MRAARDLGEGLGPVPRWALAFALPWLALAATSMLSPALAQSAPERQLPGPQCIPAQVLSLQRFVEQCGGTASEAARDRIATIIEVYANEAARRGGEAAGTEARRAVEEALPSPVPSEALCRLRLPHQLAALDMIEKEFGLNLLTIYQRIVSEAPDLERRLCG